MTPVGANLARPRPTDLVMRQGVKDPGTKSWYIEAAKRVPGTEPM